MQDGVLPKKMEIGENEEFDGKKITTVHTREGTLNLSTPLFFEGSSVTA